MSEIQEAIVERTQALATMLKAARTAAGRSTEECASILGITPDDYLNYETGKQSPSLPELEGLAYFLDIPLENFWDTKTAPTLPNRQLEHLPILIQIRQRMIGAMIRHARQETGASSEQLARWCELDEAKLEAIELGRIPIPLPLLESMTGFLHRSIREFHDRHGPVGIWNMQQRALQEFSAMPTEMQEFISKPVNRPYLELAMRLSEISTDRLRAVAEGLLEITY